MERPKGSFTNPEREVTGEIVYLDELWRNDQRPDSYDSLTDMARVLYEETADLYASQGVRPAIMDEYERYDARRSDLQYSCSALAEELLKLKEVDTPATFVDIVIEKSASDVLHLLQQTKVSELLAADDEQLAFESDGSYYPVLNIKKQDSKALGAGLTVYGLNSEKYYFVDEKRKSRALRYPNDEQERWYQFELRLSYEHPQAGTFSEIITLSVSSPNNLRLSSRISVSAYVETGYEGHNGKGMTECSDDDIAAFADIIAEIVGDNPISVRQYQDRQFDQFINHVCIAESAEYLREWVDNSWSGQVVSDIRYAHCGEVSLAKALLMPDLAAAAHEQLVRIVDRKRLQQNATADESSTKKYYGPWHDRVAR